MLNQKRWDVKVPVYRDVIDSADGKGTPASEHAVVEYEVEVRLSTVEETDAPVSTCAVVTCSCV